MNKTMNMAAHLSALLCSAAVLGGCEASNSGLEGLATNSAEDGCPQPFSILRSSEDVPTEIGVGFSGSLLPCLMDEENNQEWNLSLIPDEGSIAPYDHAFVMWNPQGHVPPFVYDVPHLDFHFYFTPQALREGYCPADNTDAPSCLNLPTANEAPLGFAATPPEPGHGVHWVDLSAPEFTGQSFTRTLIYGSYDGDMVFIEPMITTEFLLGMSEKEIKLPIPTPLSVGIAGWYPGAYIIRYRPEVGEYEIILSDFVLLES